MVEHPLLAAHRQLTELLRPWTVHRLPDEALNDQHYLSARDDSLPLGSRHFSHRGHQRLAELVVGAVSHGR